MAKPNSVRGLQSHAQGFGLEAVCYSDVDSHGYELHFRGEPVASKLSKTDAQVLKCLIALRLRTPKTAKRMRKWLGSAITELCDPA